MITNCESHVTLFKDGCLWMNGTAIFHTKDQTVICDELYTHDGIISTYKYSLRFVEGILYIFKHDGMPLHEFEFMSSTYPMEATHNHLCVQDLYCASIVIYAPNNFDISYTVSGPNKKYLLTKQYCPIIP